MFRNVILKAMVESLISWVVVAMIVYLTRNVTFVQALTAPNTIVIAVSAFVGSCIGYQRRARKQSQTNA